MNSVSATACPRTHRNTVLVGIVLIIGLLAAMLSPGRAEAATNVPARTATEVSIANSVRKLLNTERAVYHLQPVAMRTKLINSARGHNLAMAHANIMSHQERGEKALGSRLNAVGYNWSWGGENIGWNSAMTTAGVLMLEKTMYNEHAPNNGHRLNILNSHFTNVGVDVYLDKTHHKVWLTVDFGRPSA